MDGELDQGMGTERVDYIIEYANTARYFDRSVLLALLRCISLDEALYLLSYAMEYDLDLRDALVYVFEDYEFKGRNKTINEYTRYLIGRFPSIESKRKVSAYMVLERLYRVSSRSNKRRVIDFLLSQKYVGGRRRALKIMDHRCISERQEEILSLAFEAGEYMAAIIVLHELSDEIVYSYRKKLVSALEHGSQISRIYIKAAVIDIECIEELKELDGISYAYVRAKLNMPLNEKVATLLLGKYQHDSRLGLLAWSFGKMKLWSSVQKVAEIRDEFVPADHGNDA